MRKLFALHFFLFFVSQLAFSQNGFPNYYTYHAFYSKADSLFLLKNYAKAAEYYSQAANVKVEKAFSFDYADANFNAARCYALAGKNSKAFFHLNTLAHQCKYTEYDTLVSETAFKALMQSNRWQPIATAVKNNRLIKENRDRIYSERTTFTGKNKEILFQPHTKEVQDYLDNDSLPFLSINYENFRIYFRGNSIAASHLDEIKTDLDTARQRVLAICDVKEYYHGINFIMVDSAGESQELTGFYIHGGMSMPEAESVLIVFNNDNENPFSHELFHFVSNDLWGIYSARLLQEGGAVYTECRKCNVIDTIVAAIFREQKSFPLSELINSFDDKARENEIIAYYQSAAFFKFLYENYGIEKVERLWAKGFDEFEDIYGKPLSDFEKEWETYIRSLPVPAKYDWEYAALHGC